MKRAFWAWVSWFVLLFIADFVIPFHFFGDVKRVTGSFLFWIVWIVVALISMFLIVGKWRDSEQ